MSHKIGPARPRPFRRATMHASRSCLSFVRVTPSASSTTPSLPLQAAMRSVIMQRFPTVTLPPPRKPLPIGTQRPLSAAPPLPHAAHAAHEHQSHTHPQERAAAPQPLPPPAAAPAPLASQRQPAGCTAAAEVPPRRRPDVTPASAAGAGASTSPSPPATCIPRHANTPHAYPHLAHSLSRPLHLTAPQSQHSARGLCQMPSHIVIPTISSSSAAANSRHGAL